ncbi:hypothetical protein AVEN_11351-1 [Araneus ventricosus]|uniref:Uncharacterized protein n=1 Tax=Araneus ventricosus TaxID=182803 RepID=A0A4Y2HC68_ARAVE|nr:hypothetical protein AVEN_11351-1 [Araneus ventricosus]
MKHTDYQWLSGARVIRGIFAPTHIINSDLAYVNGAAAWYFFAPLSYFTLKSDKTPLSFFTQCRREGHLPPGNNMIAPDRLAGDKLVRCSRKQRKRRPPDSIRYLRHFVLNAVLNLVVNFSKKRKEKKRRKHKLMKETRKGDVLLSKFRTNMLPTNKLLHRFNIVSSPNCEFCVHAEETISHILFHFSRYRDPRLQLLKEIQDLNPVDSDTSLQSLLNLVKNAKIKLRALEKFFLFCNRF